MIVGSLPTGLKIVLVRSSVSSSEAASINRRRIRHGIQV